MSAGASTSGELPDQEHLHDAAATELRPRIRAYAETPTGVHSVSLEEGLERFQRCRAAESAEGSTVPLVWIDIASPGEAEAELMRDRLGFHPLAVEDTIRGRQRPKLDRYSGYYFLVLYAAAINPERHRMALQEVHVFLGRNYLVTVHDHRIRELGEVVSRWRTAPERFREVGALAHAILDGIVDGYFPILDHLSDRVAEIESRVMDSAHRSMDEILAMRRELTLLRKILGPEREMLGTLLRRDLPFLSPDLLPYYQDVYDHAIRVVEEIDTLRDLLSLTLDAQLSVASNQLNATMRVMAAWSIILMAMAWIAGVYGMNFRIIPELEWRLGYAWALGLMLAVGAALLAFFRRRRWI